MCIVIKLEVTLKNIQKYAKYKNIKIIRPFIFIRSLNGLKKS